MFASSFSKSSILLVAIAAAGCGGNGDTHSSTASGGTGGSGAGGATAATTSGATTSASTGTSSTGTTSSAATTGSSSSGTASSSSSSSSSSSGTATGDPCRGTALPTGQTYVPAGLCARLVASVGKGLRQLTFAPNGDLFGTMNTGSIRRLHDTNNNGVFEAGEIAEYATTGGNGNNAHIDVAGGFIYAGSSTGVKRFPFTAGGTTGGAGEDVVTGEPTGGSHPLHTVHVYDGFLYVHSGSNANEADPLNGMYDTTRSLVRRFDLSKFKSGTPFAWTSGEIFSSGLRNMVGFTKNAAGRMFGVVNGLDDIRYPSVTTDIHNDNPGEQVVELGAGKSFGYPFCFTAQRVVMNGTAIAAGTQLINQSFMSEHDDTWCAANSSKPATFVQAHSAPLDITFFDTAPKGGLPEKWRGGAFVSLHGSWDRGTATGEKVVWIPVDGNGDFQMPTSDANTTTFPYEIVFGGGNSTAAKDGPWSWSAGGMGESPRPVGVAISPIDGALYISSDASGMVYRVGIQN